MSNLNPLLRVLALMLAAAGVAPAQGSTPDSLPVQLRQCAALTDAGGRLACYDALAGSPALNGTAASTPAANPSAASGAAAAPTIAATGPTPAQTDMEFGVHNGALEAKLVNPRREKHMVAVVSAISNRPLGELVVTLDNGQVWTQIEATRYPLKTGDHVEIDVGAMGSYVLWSPANRRATKVTRIS